MISSLVPHLFLSCYPNRYRRVLVPAVMTLKEAEFVFVVLSWGCFRDSETMLPVLSH